MIDIKLSGELYNEIFQDLNRPHPFALERIGFALGRIGSCLDNDRIVYLTKYHVIPDGQYIDDPTVGARIGSDAIVWATQAAFYGRPTCEGIFHVHLHAHRGEPAMSITDAREIPKLIPGFRSVGRESVHGIMILSFDHGTAWVSLPGETNLIIARTISVIGAPISTFQQRSPT